MKEIELTQGKTTIVDDADYEWLSKWKWCFSGHGYALRGERQGNKIKNISMHRQIMQALPGTEVDHINGNTLDNRRENLRVCLSHQNRRNQKIHTDNKYGYKGISYRKDKGKWHSQIRLNGKSKHLGYFNTPEEAARAYNEGALHYYGTFARLNKI